MPSSASDFSPKFVTGARLPHAWIKRCSGSARLNLQPLDVSYVDEFTKDDIVRRQFSTLDLAGFDTFTLIVGPDSAWEDKFTRVQELLERVGVRVQLWVLNKDFLIVDQRQATLFENQGEFEDGGGLIVRPDQHILGLLSKSTTAHEMASLVLGHLGQAGQI